MKTKPAICRPAHKYVIQRAGSLTETKSEGADDEKKLSRHATKLTICAFQKKKKKVISPDRCTLGGT